jgi:hypothetical protein
MPYSNYPHGFTNGVTIRGIPLQQSQPGQVFFVNNSSVLADGGIAGSNGNPGTYQKPFATIDYAVGRCLAGRGDLILVMPGHAETISSSSVLALDVAGVAILGLGVGSARPTLTFTAAAATINVTAANITVSNILHVANFAAVASAYTNNAAVEFCVDNCEFRDTSSILNFVAVVTTTVSVSANGLTFTRNKVFGLGTTAATTPIKLLANTDRVTINDNQIVLAALSNTSALLAHAALVVTNLEMARNSVFRPSTDTATGGLLVTRSSTTNTGHIFDNKVKCLDVAGMILVTTGSAYGFTNNLCSGTADTSGILIPAADSDAS